VPNQAAANNRWRAAPVAWQSMAGKQTPPEKDLVLKLEERKKEKGIEQGQAASCSPPMNGGGFHRATRAHIDRITGTTRGGTGEDPFSPRPLCSSSPCHGRRRLRHCPAISCQARPPKPSSWSPKPIPQRLVQLLTPQLSCCSSLLQVLLPAAIALFRVRTTAVEPHLASVLIVVLAACWVTCAL
jgi:hypothetical protein